MLFIFQFLNNFKTQHLCIKRTKQISIQLKLKTVLNHTHTQMMLESLSFWDVRQGEY